MHFFDKSNVQYQKEFFSFYSFRYLVQMIERSLIFVAQECNQILYFIEMKNDLSFCSACKLGKVHALSFKLPLLITLNCLNFVHFNYRVLHSWILFLAICTTICFFIIIFLILVGFIHLKASLM